jgi:hypothetical protein
VQWSEGLSDSVFVIIRRYIDHMKFVVSMAVWFITFFYVIVVALCIVYILLYVLYVYV